MTSQDLKNQSYQIVMILDNDRKVVKIPNLNAHDVANIDDIVDLKTIRAIYNLNRFHDILLHRLLEWDQDRIIVSDLVENLRSRWTDHKKQLIDLAFADLADLYEVDQIEWDPIEQAVQCGLAYFDMTEIIEAEFDDNTGSSSKIIGAELLIAGRVLKEITKKVPVGIDQSVTIKA